MASDIDYDTFDYHSSQHYLDIEDQIDLFEFRQSLKCKTKSKRKVNKISYTIPVPSLKPQTTLVKMFCLPEKRSLKAERKSLHFDRYPIKREFFQCDEEFRIRPIHTPANAPSILPKNLDKEHRQNFSDFRRYFYQICHQRIKSALQDQSNIKIVDIRPASVNESVQDEFMRTLNTDASYFPQLVYHGTTLNNIASILRYGFLIPNRAHPTNKEAPIITSLNGQAFGVGIYASRHVRCSLSFARTTNTLLVCAALPKHDQIGRIKDAHGHILVLPHVGRIIPLFLVDFQYLNGSGTNRPLYFEVNESTIDKDDVAKTHRVNSRKYLRRILTLINEHKRKNCSRNCTCFNGFINDLFH